MAVPPPPRPPAASAPKPPAPPAPAAKTTPPPAPAVAEKPAAAAAPAAEPKKERKERVVKFGDASLAVPEAVGGVNLAWFKEVVKSAVEQVPEFAKYTEAFEALNVATFPNTVDGKRAYKVAKAINTFALIINKKARAPRTPGKVADRVRATILEMVSMIGADLVQKKMAEKMGAEQAAAKWAEYAFTEAELAA